MMTTRGGGDPAAARAMWRRTAVATAAAVLALTTISAAALTPPPLPALPLDTAAAIGEQPHLPVASCSFPRLGPSEIRTVFSQWGPTGATDPGLSSADTVDPFNPCHVMQVLPRSQNRAAAAVVRSDDNGRRFATVFSAPSSGGTSTGADSEIHPAMTIAPVLTPAPGDEYLVDTTGQYGVVHSGDGGVHWEQRNQGLPLLAGGGSTLAALALAPSNPQVGYVVVLAPASTGGGRTLLFRTADGGLSWSLLPAQSSTIADVAVDPGDQDHVIVSDPGGPAVWESQDAGTTWSRHDLPSGQSPTSLLLTRLGDAGADRVRIYVRCRDGNGGIGWMRSVDGGQSWMVLPVPQAQNGTDVVLAADPRNPDRMVLAEQPDGEASQHPFGSDDLHNPLTLFSSEDGFVSVKQSGPLRVSWASGALQPWIEAVTRLRLMTDHDGDFFLQVVAPAHPATDEHGVPMPPSPVGDHLVGFRLGAVAALPPPPPPPPPARPISQVTGPVAPAVGQCNLPLTVYRGSAPFDVPLAPLQPTMSGLSGGSLTYDGRYLDYTEDNDPPSTAGLIDRIDPLTCQPAAPLRVDLPVDPTGHPPVIRQLTYDPRYVFGNGHHGAILPLATWPNDDRGGRFPFPIYAIDPLTGASELALSVAHDYGPQGNACCYVFSYDVTRDALWVMLYGYRVALVPMPGAHGAAVAPVVQSCMTTQSPFGPPEYYATLLAVANGVMYAQLEDDSTVVRGDDTLCTALGGFRHTKFAEPSGEDEQIACDPITDGEGSPSARDGRPPATLIWVRDSVSHTAQSYAVPDGFCPFVTLLSLLPSPAVVVGSAVSLCAVLELASAEGMPLAGQAVSLSVDGRPLGSARTDAQGRACITAAAPLQAGAHRVHADFAGTHVSYLPSSADGGLITYALAARGRSGAPAFPLAGETPPLPVVQPVEQPQPMPMAEAQLQAQANTQGSTQLQSAVMVQRQRQRQVQTAIESVRVRSVSPAYNASRIRGGRSAAAPAAVTVAVLLLGLATLRRRPAFAVARPRRPR